MSPYRVQVRVPPLVVRERNPEWERAQWLSALSAGLSVGVAVAGFGAWGRIGGRIVAVLLFVLSLCYARRAHRKLRREIVALQFELEHQVEAAIDHVTN